MPPHRDLAAFDERAPRYDTGWLGKLHHEIADRTAALALERSPSPQVVLDIGCGTGYLLRAFARRCPGAQELTGVDPSPAMVQLAASSVGDPRLRFRTGSAERLSFPAGTFDLVVSTTSFDHWSDQQAGLNECARVLRPGGRLVLVDQFSWWLVPTLLAGRRGKARTKRRATRLLLAAGFRSAEWVDVRAVIIKAVTALR